LTNYSTNISIPAAATTGVEIVFTVGAQTSGTWVVGNIQLEKGSTATNFDVRPYTTELQLCQRYYEITHVSFSGYGNNSSSIITSIPFKVTKRASPTVAFGADTGSWTTNFPTATANVFGADEVSVQTGSAPTTGLSRYNATTTLTSEL
jgi:hypothetical protein